MQKTYFVYITTNYSLSTFYIGVTNNLSRRIYEHKNKLIKGFTSTYHLTKLVYFEEFQDIGEAIKREKQLKNWHKDWKLNLIRSKNPLLLNLMEDAETSSA